MSRLRYNVHDEHFNWSNLRYQEPRAERTCIELLRKNDAIDTREIQAAVELGYVDPTLQDMQKIRLGPFSSQDEAYRAQCEIERRANHLRNPNGATEPIEEFLKREPIRVKGEKVP